MSQGFDKEKPAFQADLLSGPVRTNMNALATNNAGSTAPSDPEEGWWWLDTSDPTDLKLWCYLSNTWKIVLQNIQAGPPSQTQIGKYVHTQAVAGASWSINHALNTVELVVAVLDGSNEEMIPNTITHTDANNTTITFGSAKAGKAIIIG